MQTNEYSIDEQGIYYLVRVYHDDLECRDVVDFKNPEKLTEQFQDFLKQIEQNGKFKAMKDLKQQFRGLRDLLA